MAQSCFINEDFKKKTKIKKPHQTKKKPQNWDKIKREITRLESAYSNQTDDLWIHYLYFFFLLICRFTQLQVVLLLVLFSALVVTIPPSRPRWLPNRPACRGHQDGNGTSTWLGGLLQPGLPWNPSIRVVIIHTPDHRLIRGRTGWMTSSQHPTKKVFPPEPQLWSWIQDSEKVLKSGCSLQIREFPMQTGVTLQVSPLGSYPKN